MPTPAREPRLTESQQRLLASVRDHDGDIFEASRRHNASVRNFNPGGDESAFGAVMRKGYAEHLGRGVYRLTALGERALGLAEGTIAPAPKPKTKKDLAWRRRAQGYMRGDGSWFLERGAPMTGGGTAWLILRRVDPDRVARDSLTAHDTRDGAVLWSVDADGHTNTEHLDFTGPLYAHDFDAGSLAEAKYAVTTVEEREAAQAVDQSADQSTSHTGSAR